MNWIHTNILGKFSFIMGAIALFFVLATISAHELNDGKPGLTSYLLSNIVYAFSTSDLPRNEPVMSPTSLFPLSEKHEKRVLIYTAVAFVAISFLFSLLSERVREFNLYYAGGVLASFSALMFISIPLAFLLTIPTLVAFWYFKTQST